MFKRASLLIAFAVSCATVGFLASPGETHAAIKRIAHIDTDPREKPLNDAFFQAAEVAPTSIAASVHANSVR